jgi:hypothetical protein
MFMTMRHRLRKDLAYGLEGPRRRHVAADPKVLKYRDGGRRSAAPEFSSDRSIG